MKNCFHCGKRATHQRTVLSNDPYQQHCCPEHKTKESPDSMLWVSTEWETISGSNKDIHNHIHRG